jgi:hypothetical protein
MQTAPCPVQQWSAILDEIVRTARQRGYLNLLLETGSTGQPAAGLEVEHREIPAIAIGDSFEQSSLDEVQVGIEKNSTGYFSP